jgi:hypothetical protein
MKGKMKLVLAALLACSTAANAQMVSYEKKYDNPNDYKRTKLFVDLFNVDWYLNATIGSGLRLETVVADRLMPWAQVKFALADAATKHVVSGYPTNENGQKKQLITDVGAALFLVNKNKTKKVKIVLSSFSTGRTTTTKYIKIPATVKKMFGVEGGLNYNRRAIGFEDESHAMYKYESMDGQTTLPIPSVGSSNTQPTGEAYKPQSMTNIASVFGGIHLRTVTNVSISAKGSGWKSNHTVTDFYIDAMLAPVIPIAHVIDNSGVEWKIKPEKGAIRNLGWRVGYVHHNSENTVGFQYNFEFGQKPGPKMGDDLMSSGAYISLGFGLTIGSDKHIGLGMTKKKPAGKTEAPKKSEG